MHGPDHGQPNPAATAPRRAAAAPKYGTLVGPACDDLREEAQRRVSALWGAVCEFAGDIVLDDVGGSGTTHVACAKTGRKSIYVDCCETYVAGAITRVRDAHRELLAA